jgi:hypothetical protein
VAKATLTISRNSPRDLKFRGIEVLVDGKFVGDLVFGKELRVDVDAGSHTVKVTNRLSSRFKDFEAGEGEEIRFETVGIAMGGLWLIIAILGTVAYRVTLERVA